MRYHNGWAWQVGHEAGSRFSSQMHLVRARSGSNKGFMGRHQGTWQPSYTHIPAATKLTPPSFVADPPSPSQTLTSTPLCYVCAIRAFTTFRHPARGSAVQGLLVFMTVLLQISDYLTFCSIGNGLKNLSDCWHWLKELPCVSWLAYCRCPHVSCSWSTMEFFFVFFDSRKGEDTVNTKFPSFCLQHAKNTLSEVKHHIQGITLKGLNRRHRIQGTKHCPHKLCFFCFFCFFQFWWYSS